MDNLRLTFLIFGIVAIVAVLVHGLWTIRKKAKGSGKPKFQSRDWNSKSASSVDDDNAESYDSLGLGSVRVVSKTDDINNGSVELQSHDDLSITTEDHLSDDAHLENEKNIETPAFKKDEQNTDDERELSATEGLTIQEQLTNEAQSTQLDNDKDSVDAYSKELPELDDGLSLSKTEMDFRKLAEEHEQEAPSKLYGSVVTQPKPEFHKANRPNDTSHRQSQSQDNENIPEPPPFLLRSQAAKPDVNPAADNLPVADFETSAAATDRIEPEFKLDAEQAPIDVPKPISLAQQAKRLVTRRKKSVADSIRKEPQLSIEKKLNDEQMRIDFTNNESLAVADEVSSIRLVPSANKEPATHDAVLNNDAPVANTQSAANVNAQASTSAQQEQPTDVLVLNVRAPADREITGAALLPMLLTLGLKFGEQDIFHRHVNTNGKGPVLFSLANLFKPGVFDIDNIENFSTRGLSLFMMLPIEGDPQQVFNMMHNAARKIADEFSCQILDGSRGVLTKQGLQKYSERIRDFERKRINR